MSQYFWVSKRDRGLDPSRVGLAQLALPILLESILRSTVNLADVAFLSRVSPNVVNAVSVSSQYIMLCQIVATAVATGTIVCINQAIGMKNINKVNKLASIAVAANAALGLLFGALFLLFSRSLLVIMKLSPDTIDAASRYMQVAGGLMVFQCVEIVLSNICRSMGHTRAPLAINITVNLLNVVGNYLAVFHPELLHVDPVIGVALASTVSRVGGMILALIIACRAGVHISPHELKPFPLTDFKLALSIGIPGGLNNLAYCLSQLVTTSIISLTGDTVVSAKVFVSQIVHYIALVGMAFAQSSSIMVGYRVGAGKYEEADTIRRLVTRIALLSNALFSLIVIFFRVPLIGIFTSNEAILTLASHIIMIDFVVEMGRALNNTIAGALQAAGDVKYQLAVNQGSGWLVSVGGSYLLGIVLGWGLYGVWLAFALDELTRGLILLFRWRSKKWIAGAEKRRRIIAETPVQAG